MQKDVFEVFSCCFFLFYHATATVRSRFWWKFTKFSRSLEHFHQFYISVVLGFLVLCQTNYSRCVFSLQRTTTLRAQYWNYHHFSLALFFFYFFSFECANLHSITICEMEIWSTNEMNCNWSTSSMTKAHVFNKRFFTGKKSFNGCNKTDSHFNGDGDVCNIFALIFSIFIEFVFHLFPTYYHFLLLTL